jgi:hypothetical protein
MMKGFRPGRHYYSGLFLGHLKFSILNDQCSIFKEEKGRTKTGRIEEVIKEKQIYFCASLCPSATVVPFSLLVNFSTCQLFNYTIL